MFIVRVKDRKFVFRWFLFLRAYFSFRLLNSTPHPEKLKFEFVLWKSHQHDIPDALPSVDSGGDRVLPTSPFSVPSGSPLIASAPASCLSLGLHARTGSDKSVSCCGSCSACPYWGKVKLFWNFLIRK